MAQLQPILHGAATALAPMAGCSLISLKTVWVSLWTHAHAGDELFMEQKGFPVLLLLNQRGGFADRGKIQSFSQGNAPWNTPSLSPSVRGGSCPSWGLGKPAELSAQSCATGLSMSWHSSAASPCSTLSQVLSWRAAQQPQIQIYFYFGDWIPAFLFVEYYCHFLKYGETQQPFLGTYCPANQISRLQSSKPKARVQECVYHINIPGVFPGFLLLLLFLGLVGVFQWLEQTEAEWGMFFVPVS